MTPEQAFDAALAAASSDQSIESLVVAVSGGGDSMALLHVAALWARAHEVALLAVTVDHGLRSEAKQEAARVAKQRIPQALQPRALSAIAFTQTPQ